MKFSKTVFTSSLASLFLFASFSVAACEIGGSHAKWVEENASALQKSNGTIELHDFRTGDCEKVTASQNELDMSAFLPLDETSQGLYAVYRKEGKSRIAALKMIYSYHRE